jgi:hypothetical protein
MYRLRHTNPPLDELDVAPSASFDSLNQAIDEAHKRMRYPSTPKKGTITIDRAEDGKRLRLWYWYPQGQEWKAEAPD